SAAGSDAASMTDTGVVCRGTWKGEEVLGIRLNFAKRYITLAPVATVLGLAFKLRDPEALLGGPEEHGISVALVPTDLPGISIGRRHLPRSEEHTSELQSRENLVCRLLLEKKNQRLTSCTCAQSR